MNLLKEINKFVRTFEQTILVTGEVELESLKRNSVQIEHLIDAIINFWEEGLNSKKRKSSFSSINKI